MHSFLKLLFIVACFIAVGNAAGCTSVTTYVANIAELRDAMDGAKAGVNIVLTNDSYASYETPLVLSADGVEGCPITISCMTQGQATVYSYFNLTSSSYVNVYNLTIVGNDYGILSNGGSFLNMENITVNNKEERGIALHNVVGAVVRNCTFNNMGFTAIRLKETTKSVVEKCTIGRVWTTGLWIDEGSTYNKITDNIFCGNGYDVLQTSWVNVDDGAVGNEVSRNFFVNPNGQCMIQGVWCIGGSDNVFKENFMVMNKCPTGGYGFHVGATTQRVCASNRFFGSANFTDGPIDMSC